MINKEERKLLRNVLGKDYTNDVNVALSQNEIRTYSPVYIRRILNNGVENSNIEMAIWKVASVRKQQQIEVQHETKTEKSKFLK